MMNDKSHPDMPHMPEKIHAACKEFINLKNAVQ